MESKYNNSREREREREIVNICHVPPILIIYIFYIRFNIKTYLHIM